MKTQKIEIFGVPGAGKTTLHKQLRSDKDFKDYSFSDEGYIQRLMGQLVRNEITNEEFNNQILNKTKNICYFCFVDTDIQLCFERNQKRQKPWGGKKEVSEKKQLQIQSISRRVVSILLSNDKKVITLDGGLDYKSNKKQIINTLHENSSN